ncbi:MAG: low molecular weight phosphotyrosine protein phosphatase [Phycisphaerales bacterium]|nr:low molecular weight phosphotyrosine protein phosphatase [Phycisphaerales bacterium]
MSSASVLFVCLGNICRSPMGKVLLARHAEARGVADRLRIDSCGTGDWHVGGPADPRTIATAQARGVIVNHRARQLAAPDADRFDLLIAMDANNRRTMIARGMPAAKIALLREYLDGPLDVPDPYHGDEPDFFHVHDLIDRATAALLDHLQAAEFAGDRLMPRR